MAVWAAPPTDARGCRRGNETSAGCILASVLRALGDELFVEAVVLALLAHVNAWRSVHACARTLGV
eukprot:6539111-Alexandrium_andersonii.AAC.1